MKSKQLLFTICSLLFVILVYAQGHKVETSRTNTSSTINQQMIDEMPFKRGREMYTLMKNFEFSNTKPETGNDHTNQTEVHLDYNYFIIDHLAIGAGFDGSFSSTKSGSNTDKISDWILRGNIIYGTPISDQANIYGLFSAGFGKSKFTYITSTTDDLFTWKAEVGFPIRTFRNDHVYTTPFLSYNFLKTKESGGEEKEHTFNFGVKFQDYSRCSEHQCDLSHGCHLSQTMYNQGRNFFGYNTMGNFGFGSSTFDPNVGSSTKTDNSGGSLDLDYGHYFFNNFALGADVQWNSQTSKYNNVKSTSSSFMFTPMFTINAPAKDCLRNLFLEGGYGFGTEKFTSGTTTNKDKLTSFCINLGYNIPFSNHLSWTTKFGYDWRTFKDDNTNIKTKEHGLEYSFGVALRY